MEYSLYLVCKEKLEEVRGFLGNFFTQSEDEYTHGEWVTFTVPNSNFSINLMRGEEQEVTKNVTFEIYYDSLSLLQEFALQNDTQVKSFETSKAAQKYTYYYVEVLGPANICKIEASYSEDVD
tara:strand:- start:473 stop:841 length:369 start_codon:yes stop_codon:yes gene_type:complete